MNKQNYIPPEFKLEFENFLKRLESDMIWYTVSAINEWFSIKYPFIHEMNKPRSEYCRLYCQYLWRKIADGKGIVDYKKEIENLKILISK